MASVTKNLSSGSAGLEPTIGDQIKPIPFRTELSLAPLLAFWARAFGDDTSLEGTFARTIREETEKAPELLSPITRSEERRVGKECRSRRAQCHCKINSKKRKWSSVMTHR